MARSKRNIGLYLGASSVGAVVFENRKVVSCAKFDLSSLEEEAKVESLSDEVKWEALINKALREVGADEKDVSVSLADKDFIFRSFPMPLMKKREIESSLVYEIGKHIPFKIEELAWDYGYATFPKEKKVNTSFLGIKTDNLEKIKRIFTHLELNTTIMEPGCLSLARALKSLKQFAAIKNFAILDFSESEAYLTFFYADLPVFNRYLAIPKEQMKTEKLVESVRMSFQYFRREFKEYEIDKFIVIGNSVSDSMISSLKSELETDVEGLSPQDFITEGTAYVENIKALGTTARDFYPYKFKPVIKIKEVAEAAEVEEKVPVAAEPLKIGLLAGVLLAGALILGGFYIYKENVLSMERYEIKKAEEAIKIPKELERYSWEDRKKAFVDTSNNFQVLREVTEAGGDLSSFLDLLMSTRVLPQGLWIDSLYIEMKRVSGLKGKGKYQATIGGFIFRDDSFQERSGVDEFINNLKISTAVSSLFPSVRLTQSDRVEKEGFELTSFTIKLE